MKEDAEAWGIHRKWEPHLPVKDTSEGSKWDRSTLGKRSKENYDDPYEEVGRKVQITPFPFPYLKLIIDFMSLGPQQECSVLSPVAGQGIAALKSSNFICGSFCLLDLTGYWQIYASDFFFLNRHIPATLVRATWKGLTKYIGPTRHNETRQTTRWWETIRQTLHKNILSLCVKFVSLLRCTSKPGWVDVKNKAMMGMSQLSGNFTTYHKWSIFHVYTNIQ